MKKHGSKNNIRFLMYASMGMLLIPSFLSMGNSDFSKANAANNDAEATQYIGYGYNVAGGKRLAENDSLQLNNPILDVDNIQLMSKVKVFNSSKTVYENYTSNKVSEISKKYGQTISGGSNIGATISAVNVNVGATFNTTKNSSWTTTQHEEYSYYTIFVKNKPVVLQIDAFEIKNYLNPTFEKSLKSIKSSADALNLLKKYGTHLPTGYTLGGMFELTNYYACNSSSYVREGNSTFASQVSTTIGSYASAGVDFSFNESFGGKDNNSYAVNNYKCTTYGGYTFPGLTIDQAFSYYETAFGAGYVYDIWTDSINSGKNLVIVDIPQSSEMIPLWDLLPVDQSYSAIRNLLMESYMSMCGNAYKTFNDIYKDVVATDLSNDRSSFSDNSSQEANYGGYTLWFNEKGSSNNTITRNIDVKDSLEDEIKVNIDPINKVGKREIYITLDFDLSNYLGHLVEWKSNNLDVVENIDSRNSIFKLNKSGEASLRLYIDGSLQYGVEKKIKVSIKNDGMFAFGDGSENNPYLITTVDEYKILTSYSANLSSSANYRLMTDIIENPSSIGQIGSDFNPFKGTFDGFGHKISLYIASKLVSSTRENVGLFAINEGTIKNLYIENTIVKIDASTTNDSIYTSKNLGIICGINRGTIANCSLKGCTLTFKSSKNAYSQKEISLGGVCGINEGSGAQVLSCEIYNSTLKNESAEETAVAHTDSIRMMYSGGICGKNDSGTVKLCMTASNRIVAKLGESVSREKYLFIAASGGICGVSLNDAKISYCLVKGYSKSSSEITASSPDTGHYGNGVAGGIAGYICASNTDKTFLTYCAVRHVQQIKGSNSGENDSAHNNKPYPNRCHQGYLAGVVTNVFPFNSNGESSSKECDFLETTALATISKHSDILDCYVMKSNDGINEITNVADDYVNSISSTLTGCYSNWASGNKNDLSSNFISDSEVSEYFVNESGNYAIINIQGYNFEESGLFVNLENVKKTFYINDHFSIGDLKIMGSYKIGSDSFEIEEYTVDCSAFDSSKAGTNIPIKIYFRNKLIAQYSVEVVDPEAYEIYATDERNQNSSRFYEGDTFAYVLKNGNTKLHKILESGSSAELDLMDIDEIKNNKNGKNPFVEKKLEAGNNEITIHYSGLEYTYHVYAEKRDVTSISVQNKEELSKLKFNLGLSSLDFGDDFKVYAYYERKTLANATIYADPEEVFVENDVEKRVSGRWELTSDEYDLTYSRVVKGKNKITVTYDLSKSDSFEVDGNQFVTLETLNSFINAVEKIKDANGLFNKYQSIKKAQQILDDIGDYTCLFIINDTDEKSNSKLLDEDGAFITAKNQLDKAISDYNAEVGFINSKFFESIKLTNYWPNTILQMAGVSILPIIVLILKKLLGA